ncbi:3-isopropylmalate dehydrogenase [Bacteroidota bacterium]
MKKIIALLPGDGIGPEIIRVAKDILEAIASKYKHEFIYQEGLIGATAINETGNPFPDETLKICINADAILFGAIGHPDYDNNPMAKVRPEQGLLKMRKELGLYANIRPVNIFPSLIERSPLKAEIIENVDFIVIRELTGGIYFGEPRGKSEDGSIAFDTCVYTKEEIIRVAKVAFEYTLHREKKLTMVDKANVLATSQLWRETIKEFSKKYKDVEVEYMFVDNAAMQLIQNPAQFDVILTENMFGDILTDEASVLSGSLGLLPSASIGLKTSVFEPIHGSYPQAAGKNIANPIGTVLSAAMLLDSFGLIDEAKCIRKTVDHAINSDFVTSDISKSEGKSTSEVGGFLVSNILDE